MTPRPANLCPYCGHKGDNPDQCPGCQGLLEPLSRRATQIAMGPWFVRSAKRPYNPGCSYPVLRKLVKAGKVKPGTPLRGPTTGQLWAPARLVPGVAHLTGFCHQCGAGVKRRDEQCHECGAAFLQPPQRDELGVAANPAEAIAAHRRVNPRLCPCCGHTPTLANRCDMCGVVFSPPDQATPVHLGPWYVRDTDAPFRHGVSYPELKHLIELGHVDGGRIVRGPTTAQFWTLARETPGVAHLLGVCHACGKSVTATDPVCVHCEEPFDAVPVNDRLGLIYQTQEDAEAAQQDLDEEVAQLTAQLASQQAAARPQSKPKPPKSPPPSRPRNGRTRSRFEDDEVPVAAPVERPGSRHSDDYDHRDDAPSHGAHPPGHPPEHAFADEDGIPAAFAIIDDEHEDLAAVAAATTTGGGAAGGKLASRPSAGGLVVIGDSQPLSGAERLAAKREQKQMQTIGVLLIGTFVLVMVALVAFFSIGGDNATSGGDPTTPGTPGTAATAGGTPSAASADEQVVSWDNLLLLRQKIEARAGKVKPFERDHGVGMMLEELDASLVKAKSFFDLRNYDGAKSSYDHAAGLIDRIEQAEHARGEAKLARSAAQTSARLARNEGALLKVKSVWEQGDNALNEAEAKYGDGKFAEAKTLFERARVRFDEARDQSMAFNRAEKAQKDFEAAVTAVFSRSQLDEMGGAVWEQVKSLEQAAKQAMEAGRMTEAVDKYKQAGELLPQATSVVRLEAGTNWYAFNAGRISADTLLAVRDGAPYDFTRINGLLKAFEPLRLGDVVTESIPQDPSAPFQTIGVALLDTIPKAIAAERGEPARAAFTVGVKFVIVNGLLKREVLTISPATKIEILKQLGELTELARTAQFTGDFFDRLAEFKSYMDAVPDDKAAITGSRKLWKELEEALASEETGMALAVRK